MVPTVVSDFHSGTRKTGDSSCFESNVHRVWYSSVWCSRHVSVGRLMVRRHMLLAWLVLPPRVDLLGLRARLERAVLVELAARLARADLLLVDRLVQRRWLVLLVPPVLPVHRVWLGLLQAVPRVVRVAQAILAVVSWSVLRVRPGANARIAAICIAKMRFGRRKRARPAAPVGLEGLVGLPQVDLRDPGIRVLRGRARPVLEAHPPQADLVRLDRRVLPDQRVLLAVRPVEQLVTTALLERLETLARRMPGRVARPPQADRLESVVRLGRPQRAVLLEHRLAQLEPQAVRAILARARCAARDRSASLSLVRPFAPTAVPVLVGQLVLQPVEPLVAVVQAEVLDRLVALAERRAFGHTPFGIHWHRIRSGTSRFMTGPWTGRGIFYLDRCRSARV